MMDQMIKKQLQSLIPFKTKIKIYHTEHLRPAGARNYGIEHADGEYILPVDSDDKIDPTYMEKAVQKIESDKK